MNSEEGSMKDNLRCIQILTRDHHTSLNLHINQG